MQTASCRGACGGWSLLRLTAEEVIGVGVKPVNLLKRNGTATKRGSLHTFRPFHATGLASRACISPPHSIPALEEVLQGEFASS
jgi:hypothetical protein